ncbi:MAG: NBR1-Ig-like domain-containing protein [Anaerolineales bacterium]|jgi:hypothetical protein
MSRNLHGWTRFMTGILLITLAAAACNFPSAVDNESIESTAAAETVAAQQTNDAIGTLVGETSMPPATEEPTQEPTDESATTPTPTVTATAEDACDRAQFISDVNYPDDTNVPPGTSFTKTWRIKNTGTCTWNADYDLVFDHGDSMGGPASVPITSGSVAPGQTVDVSVDLVAPASNGTYQGYWTLRNPDGVIFGIENSTSGTFWVKIKVGSSTSLLYSFVDHYCDAEWRSGAGLLPCPGSDTDSEGFVIKLTAPKLENGATDDEPALELHPEWVNNGVISGRFPAIDIQEGDHFRALIGCLYGGNACNVKFQITYHADGGPLQLLGQWTEIYDGNMTSIDIDLSDLAGQSVEFALVVQANGASNQDWAFWLNPQIRR